MQRMQPSPTNHTNKSLLIRITDLSDHDSWQQFHDTYVPMLQKWLGRYDMRPSEADDLVQEVMKTVASEIDGFAHNGRTGAFRNWLRTTLVHRVKNHWRSRNRGPKASGRSDVWRQLEQLEDANSELTRAWNQEHDSYVVSRLLAASEHRFRPNTWMAFQRVVLQEEKPADVADCLGISVNAVLIAKSRVLSHLRSEAAGLIDDDAL